MKQFTANVNRFKMTDRNIILKLIDDSGLSLADGKLSVNENVLDKLRSNLTADNKRTLACILSQLKKDSQRKTLKRYLDRHHNKVPHQRLYENHLKKQNGRLRIAEMQALATAAPPLTFTVHPDPEQRGKYLINWVYDYWPSTGALYNHTTQQWYRVLVSLGEIPELRIKGY